MGDEFFAVFEEVAVEGDGSVAEGGASAEFDHADAEGGEGGEEDDAAVVEALGRFRVGGGGRGEGGEDEFEDGVLGEGGGGACGNEVRWDCWWEKRRGGEEVEFG